MTTHTPVPGTESTPPAAPSTGPGTRPRTGPRTGPIIWGVIILAFCGYVAQRLFGATNTDSSWWIIATVIGLGVLLLGIGLTVVLRNHRR